MKRTAKQIIAVLAAVLIPALCGIMIASAETETGTCGNNLTWEYDNSTCTLTISGTGDMYDYDSYYYMPEPWNSFSESIKTVEISNGATSIGQQAFFGCSGLTSVTIPDGVTSIGQQAFYGCRGLTDITIPGSVTSIGRDAFMNDTCLTNVYCNGTLADWCKIESDEYASHPFYYSTCKHNLYINNVLLTEITEEDLNGVTVIGNYSFSGCDELKSVTIGNDVTSIGRQAFSYCTGLKSVTIGNGVTSIGVTAFEGCTELTEIIIPCNVRSIGDRAFAGCTALETVTLSEGIKSIDGEAVFAQTGIKSIVIPESLETMGALSFGCCYALKNIEYNAADCALKYNANPFLGCITETITIGENVEKIPNNMLGGIITINGSKCDVVLPSHNYSVNTAAFRIHQEVEQYLDVITEELSNEQRQAELTDIYGLDFSDFGEVTWAEMNIIKPDHTFLSEIIKEASCKETGEIKYTCSECGYSYTETIPKTDDHDWQKFTITPTCTQDGGDLYVCRTCGQSKTENASPAKGHSPAPSTVENSTVTNCQESGEYDEVVYCSVCGAELSREHKIRQPGSHIPLAAEKENEKSATCTQAGSYSSVVYCGICGAELSRETVTIPALGHSFTNYVYNKDATTEKDGTETAKCDRCNATDTRVKSGTKLKPGTPDEPAKSGSTDKPGADDSKTDISKVKISAPSGTKQINWKYRPHLVATAANLPKGYGIAWFEGKTKVSDSGEFTAKEGLTSNHTYTAKIVDTSGNVVSAASQEKTVKIEVKSDFFSKIISFFSRLFGSDIAEI